MIIRLAFGAAALALLLVVYSTALSEPVAAACGTNWTSKKEPPDVIRVLRTATDEVQKVDFKDYVVDVMASGEWPTSLPEALLEAGALATKQYGWYYTLEGNHRSGYKNQKGTCYDVRDDSTDQLYNPESADATDKQRTARDALWYLSLRKNDKFFLTGYRSGESSECAEDANEWKLYALSAQDCAKRLDYDSEQILQAYYEPKLDFIWAPDTEADPQETGAPDQQPTASPESDDDAESERSLFGRLFGWFDQDK
jgi:hypothetical protein